MIVLLCYGTTIQTQDTMLADFLFLLFHECVYVQGAAVVRQTSKFKAGNVSRGNRSRVVFC